MLPPSPGFWFHLYLYRGQKCTEPFGFKAHLSPRGWIQHGIGQKGQCKSQKELRGSFCLVLWLQVWKRKTFLRLANRNFPACAILWGFLQLLLWTGFSGNWEQTEMLSSKHSLKEQENSTVQVRHNFSFRGGDRNSGKHFKLLSQPSTSPVSTPRLGNGKKEKP